ncbi:unnamed protein product [Acanthoscelides obtectus]|uniref:Uncharacterized protein n=1 Tax=Acanthoscelides obtectus TaxID=200917 RepID=A0A9P0K042_ACAOB|nr:unnamed protein product [Acanthoscelides obtectus]CAK1648721.1 hypothetical protein AOBTE_LOCUS15835 [Acanthoscelides obtectus]
MFALLTVILLTFQRILQRNIVDVVNHFQISNVSDGHVSCKSWSYQILKNIPKEALELLEIPMVAEYQRKKKTMMAMKTKNHYWHILLMIYADMFCFTKQINYY